MNKFKFKGIYLDDTFSDDDYIDEFIELSESDSDSEDFEDSYSQNEMISKDNDEPKIEFIIEENKNKEKSIRLNFEFKIDNSGETIKIDLEISKKIYLEIANELLKK